MKDNSKDKNNCKRINLCVDVIIKKEYSIKGDKNV